MTDNVIINSPNLWDTDQAILFGDEEVYITDTNELSKLMVELNIYPSTSKARQAGRFGDIPTGYNEFKASKKRTLYLWNPTEEAQ